MSLVYYPADCLLKPCEPVKLCDQSVVDIVQKMVGVLEDKNGLGLSANQIGHNIQCMIVKDNKGVIHEMINPKLIESSEPVLMQEGCLSAPDIFLDIVRDNVVIVEYNNKNGDLLKMLAEGLEARIILHEMEHLSGIFFFSKVNRKLRKRAEAILRKSIG